MYESYEEDPEKMQIIEGKPRKTSIMTPLPSFPIQERQYPIETPPTYEPFNSYEYSPNHLDDIPEIRFIDEVHRKLTIQKYLYHWRNSTLSVEQKKKTFQNSLQNPRFDIESRINALHLAHVNFNLAQFFREFKQETKIQKRFHLLQHIILRQKCLKTFSKWQSAYLKKMHKITEKRQIEFQKSSTSLIPNLMGNLHTGISLRAELETELDKISEQVHDMEAIILDRQNQDQSIQEKLRLATEEKNRVIEMNASMEQNYKNQIAELQMSIRQSRRLKSDKIENAKANLGLQIKAQSITDDKISETHEFIIARKNEIEEQLKEAQETALGFREQLIEFDEEQLELEEDINEMKMEIVRLKAHCQELEKFRNNSEQEFYNTYEERKNHIEQAQEALDDTKRTIKQNNETLRNLDAQIERLNKELTLHKQREKAAAQTFLSD